MALFGSPAKRPPVIREARPGRRSQTPVSRSKSQKQQLGRFDPTSSIPLPESKIISGAAYVVDGDTIRVKNVQIRLFGIDAPELEHPYGMIAKNALFKLCKNQQVSAEVLEFDDHGRTVAKCRLSDGRDLSAEMVKLGLAIDWPKYSGGVYRELETADARKKLWLADDRQKGRMYSWYRYERECSEAKQTQQSPKASKHSPVAAVTQNSPTCPDCGANMVKRTNKKTRQAFFGCSNFPKCRGVRNLE